MTQVKPGSLLVTASLTVCCREELSPSETFVTIEPAGRRCSPIADTMPGLGGNEEFFAHGRMIDSPGDLEFHIAIKDHHQLVHLMDIVFPYLARRIGPHIAAKTPRLPILSYDINIDHGHEKFVWMVTKGKLGRDAR